MCEGVLSHRRQSAPLTVLMPNEVLSDPPSPKASHLWHMCDVSISCCVIFIFIFFYGDFSPVRVCIFWRGSKGKSEDATWKVASHKSKCSPLFGFGFWFHSFCFCFRMFFLLVSVRLGLWAVYLGTGSGKDRVGSDMYQRLEAQKIESHARSQ